LLSFSIIMIIVNLFHKYKYFSQNQTNDLGHLNINMIDEQLDTLIGQKINFSNLELVHNRNTNIELNKKLYLVGFFSIHTCGNCIFKELAEWEKIKKLNNNIQVVAVSIDKNESDIFRFISHFKPKISVYKTIENNYTFAKKATTVLLLDSKKNVINTYFSEVGNDSKRSEFYNTINLFIQQNIK
ncbi:MAG: hypothetical protein JXQ65_11940, partial [Candidatus Marinimicrobia bacterium]|nr:hypothetical protein [Candidatus Neomarinimicrobiota bacterium]